MYTGKPNASCNSLYCNICFIVVVWNQTHSISKICLHIISDSSYINSRKQKSNLQRQKADECFPGAGSEVDMTLSRGARYLQ